MGYSKDNFPEITSCPNWIRTWSIRGIFLFVFGVVSILFYLLPVLFNIDGTMEESTVFTFMAIYYPLIFGLTFFTIRYFKRIKGNSVRKIWVNHKGIFYQQVNGTVVLLLYHQMESSRPPVIYDVFTKTFRKGLTVLRVVIGGIEKTVPFENTDVACSYYTRNHRELRSLFIQGIQLFRPDLKIVHLCIPIFISTQTHLNLIKRNFKKWYYLLPLLSY